MKTIVRLSILFILYFLVYIVYRRFDSYIMIPLTTLIIISMFVYDFFLLRIKLNNGRAIKLGTNNSAKWSKVLGVVGGLVFFVLGFRLNYNEFAYWGINGTSYLGLLFIAMGLTINENYEILLRDKYLKYRNFGFNPEVQYKKIKEVMFDENRLVITTKNDNIEYDISDDIERKKLIDFLLVRLGDRLIINE
nr:hypothetical protein [uncultured Carboxylicivirga sp.]